jgi:hypothetical protein
MKSASVAALLITIGLSAAAAAQNVATEEFMIPAVDPGISLFVRNKHPVDQTAFPPGKILLFVHGATCAGKSVLFSRCSVGRAGYVLGAGTCPGS